MEAHVPSLATPTPLTVVRGSEGVPAVAAAQPSWDSVSVCLPAKPFRGLSPGKRSPAVRGESRSWAGR